MGWPWSSKSSPSPPSTDTDTDPLRDLDPNLRAFLDSETPPTQPAPPPPPPPPPTKSDEPTPSSAPKVPPQSLYPDGRYAHLWSTYKPLREIQLANQSDQEKVQEVLEGYKERKAQIGRTALENCAMEQTEVDKCFKTGGFKSRMTMCRAENKEFNRCFTMQSRFLQALGYLGAADRTEAKEEEIQMHADTLYQRMLMQERAIEAAKAANEPVPTFSPLLSSPSAQPPSASHSPSDPLPLLSEPSPMPGPPTTKEDSDPLSPSARAALMERVKKLPTAEERELEERAVTMEARTGMSTAAELARLHEAQIKERKERREKGQATVADSINALFGW